jgi:hypothetical protein
VSLLKSSVNHAGLQLTGSEVVIAPGVRPLTFTALVEVFCALTDSGASPRLVSRLRDEDAEPRNASTYDLALFHGAMGEVAKLDREIARLRALLATHGIDPDVTVAA